MVRIAPELSDRTGSLVAENVRLRELLRRWVGQAWLPVTAEEYGQLLEDTRLALFRPLPGLSDERE